MNSQAPRLWCGQFKHQHIGHKGPLVHENTFGEDYSNPALHRVGLLCRSQSRMALLRGAENTSCKTSRKTKMPSSTLIWLQRCKHRSPPRPPPGKGSRRKGEFKTAPPRSACCPFSLGLCHLLAAGWHPCTLQPSLSRRTLPLQHFCLCHARSRSSASADPLQARRCFVHVCLSIVRPSCPSDRRTPYLDVHGV